MSTVEQVLSLAIKSQGLQVDRLSIQVLTDVREELSNLPVDCEVLLEKLQILATVIRLPECGDGAKNPGFIDEVRKIWLPIFERLAGNLFDSSSNRAIAGFLAEIVLHCHLEAGGWTVIQAIDSIISNSGDNSDLEIVKMQNALLVVEQMLKSTLHSPTTQKVRKELILHLSKVITSADDTIMQSSIGPQLIRVFLKGFLLVPYDEVFFQQIWSDFEDLCQSVGNRFLRFDQVGHGQLLRRCLKLIDIIMEISVSKKGNPIWSNIIGKNAANFLNGSYVWLAIQQGLLSKVAPVRKQALFNLRQALFVVREYDLTIDTNTSNQVDSTSLFHWSVDSKRDSAEFWHSFILTVETLEENQLHVITPVLIRFNAMIEKTSSSQCPIHTSWVSVLLLRMMQHESKAISKEGLVMCLKLDPHSCPFLTQSSGANILEKRSDVGVLPALQDVNLFCDFKDSATMYSEGKLPIVAELLGEFFRKCAAAHPSPSKFLKHLLRSINVVNWSSIPLYYFCHGLRGISEQHAWEGGDLQELRSVILKCLRTQDVRLRHSILDLLLQCMVKFTKCSECESDHLLNIISDVSDVKEFSDTSASSFSTIFSWLCTQFEYFEDMKRRQWQGLVHYLYEAISLYCNQVSEESLISLRKRSKINAIVALIAEKSVKESEQKDFRIHTISMLEEIIGKGSTHLYMPKDKVGRAIIMLNCIVTSWLARPIKNGKSAVSSIVWKSLASLQSYAAMRFSMNPDQSEDVCLYLQTWLRLSLLLRDTMPKELGCERIFQGFLPLLSLVKQSLCQVSSDGNIRTVRDLKISVSCFSVLHYLCLLAMELNTTLDVRFLSEIQEISKHFDLCTDRVSDKLRRDVEMRDVVVDYSLRQWSCIPFILRLDAAVHNLLHQKLFKSFLSCLDTVTETNIPQYLTALGTVICHDSENHGKYEDWICKCLEVSWKAVSTLSQSPSFWPAYKSFVSTAFQASTLSRTAPQKIQEKVIELLSNIADAATLKPNILRYLCEVCINTWMKTSINSDNTPSGIQDPKKSSSASADCLKIHLDFILRCLTFGHVPKKEDHALQHALSLASSESVDNQGNSASLSYHYIRISALSLLLQLDPESPSDCAFVTSVFKQLMNFDIELTLKKSRYHHGSLQHHVKTGIYQAILALLPFVSGSEDYGLIVEHIMRQLQNDAQPSVRYLMEWILASTISGLRHGEALLMEQLTCGVAEASGGAKFSAICSYLTTALFVGLSKPANLQDDYFLRLLDICWPWCMCQQFSIRLYALAVILRIQIHFENGGKIHVLTEKYPALASCMLFADGATGNVGKNWDKMKDNFFLFDFHPVRDYSLETIYINLPRLCNMLYHPNTNDLSAASVSMATSAGFKTGLSLWNRDECLRKRGPTKWIPQEPKSTAEHSVDQSQRYRKNFGGDADVNPACDNVQKKIMPWLDLAESALQTDEAVRPPGLILVASLIDKSSNLGGLTRTCEIFGAEAMVVQSCACTADKVYQSLSVTAHQWLPMKEIKPWALEDYLSKMRDRGYTLVGVEQTAQSVCMSAFRFPRKCVLVLGNEKEGIPLGILKVMDVCLQIPQKGIVRSLNVHVSGAIAIWEYTRQHLV